MSTKAPIITTQVSSSTPSNTIIRRFAPLVIFFAMVGAFLFMGAVLPLYGLFFHTALLNALGNWTLVSTQVLFPGHPLTPTLLGRFNSPPPPSVGLSWQDTGLLLGAFLLIALVYGCALRYLPERVTFRFVIYAAGVLGGIFVLTPVVTSQDLYSYIIYARMETIYHLNPLITIPKILPSDPAYTHLYWQDQPSAYGPTWIAITGGLQWLTSLLFGAASLTPMVLALRLLGLAAHLWSTLLVWSIGGRLQSQYCVGSPGLRLQATLAFAWNPLLLFEACINAHNDTVLLLLVLLAVWLLVRQPSPGMRDCLLATLMLALATCLKVNIALLLPGVLLFLWTQPQRLRTLFTAIALYLGSIVLLYAFFWQGGAILGILHINPSTSRNINTIPESLSHLYDNIAVLLGYRGAPEIGSTAELTLHTLSMVLFVMIYGFSLGHIPYTRRGITTAAELLRWMCWMWLLYCALGTPWFWPWYAVTFFGLFALLEAIDGERWRTQPILGVVSNPIALRILACSLVSLYCFYTWAPFVSFIPGLAHFRWAWLRGFWAWGIPLLVLFLFKEQRPSTESSGALPEMPRAVQGSRGDPPGE